MKLLQKSRRDNLASDITGMLLYMDGTFMQTLEGPAIAVQTLMEKIKSDPRHGDLTILMKGPIWDRSFGTWSMGFKQITREALISVPGYQGSGDLSLMSRQFLQNPRRSFDLLHHFTQKD